HSDHRDLHSFPTRRSSDLMACWRKSGVVSMTTFWPSRDRRMEGRRRLSCGSVEPQTRQGQPSVGTPMEVPEPSTVIFSGVFRIAASRLKGFVKTQNHFPPVQAKMAATNS